MKAPNWLSCGIKLHYIILLIIGIQLFALPASAQLRKIFSDANADNHIKKLSFYGPNEGYVAFLNWIGYTTDSGHTFTRKPITISNVDYNGYAVNLTIGFYSTGCKAFDKNTLIVYGNYGLVPAILYSSNGGDNFKLVFHSQYSPTRLTTGILDMIFPLNGNIGYAVDADRILKTTDKGLTWTIIRTEEDSWYEHIGGSDDNNIYAYSSAYHKNQVIVSGNGGGRWQPLTLPGKVLNAAWFSGPGIGWLNMDDGGGSTYFTSNAGVSWSLKNTPAITPFTCNQMSFINDSTGYALTDLFEVYRTSDSGRIWEQLPRDNTFTYLGYTLNDLQYQPASKQIWTGGGHGFLELGTQGGGITRPKAYFTIDSSKLAASRQITLNNYSRPGYSYTWLRNDTLIGDSYNASFTHADYPLTDTLKLIVSNGKYADTATTYAMYHPPVVLTSFSPAIAAGGSMVSIRGANFAGTISVTFGGSPAAFTVLGDTLIKATVGVGASGDVVVTTKFGNGKLPGFTFIPGPVIASFTPTSAIAGTAITIQGEHFTDVSKVEFGGTTAASFTLVSDNQITAVPVSGSSGAVSVTTPGGTAKLTYFAELPYISSYTPTTGSNGMLMTINGTGLNGTAAVTLGGSAVRTYTVNGSTSLTVIVGAGAQGNVSVTTPNGTASFTGFKYVQGPVITAMTPMSGAPGSSVTVTGMRFGPAPADNIVYFGTVKAQVTAASANSLTVIVPTGAGLAPVSVTTNHLTASTARPFIVTFPNGGSITPHSFAPKIDVDLPESDAQVYVLGDIDGDGRTDVAAYLPSQHLIGVQRNTSTPGSVSFVHTSYDAGNWSNTDQYGPDPGGLSLVDLDGDGLKDMIVSLRDTIFVYGNRSTPGDIRFTDRVALPGSSGIGTFFLDDVDGDGRSDLIIFNSTDGNVSVYLNSSSPTQISFTVRKTFTFPGSYEIRTGDIDGDGRRDIVIAYRILDKVSVMRNTSTIGSVSFATPFNITTTFPTDFYIADLDNDGRQDITTIDGERNIMGIFRNLSTAGSLAFDSRIDIFPGDHPSALNISDLDGDGSLDIAVVAQQDTAVNVMKNLSSPGHIQLSPFSRFATYGRADGVAIDDMDGDGRNDILALHSSRAMISVLRNTVSQEPFVRSFNPTIAAIGTPVTITGTNFTGVTAVSFGGVAAASFTINSSTSLTAVPAGGANGAISVTNPYGTAELAGFTFGLVPEITSFTPSTGPVGATVTITGVNFGATIADNTVYFGKAKATVVSASATSIVVKAPAAATYAPISVTANGRTTASARSFSITFPGAGSSFTPYSFGARQDFHGPLVATVADIDGDGLLDIVNGDSVKRNTSTPNHLSFATVAIPRSKGFLEYRYATGDLDGDGKPDLVGINEDSSKISVWKNNSLPGNITFSLPVTFTLGVVAYQPDVVTIADIDKDGKLDMIVGNYNGYSVSVYRNISSTGVIAFANRIDFGMGAFSSDIACTDIDGDGRLDIAVGSVLSTGVTTVLRNTSTPGFISFATRIEFSTGNYSTDNLQSGDFDGDGKPDIAVASNWSSQITLLKNSSTIGSVSFVPGKTYTTGYGPSSLPIADLDGDGKPDLLTGNEFSGSDYYGYPYNVSVYKNTSSGGAISLAPKVDYTVVKPTQYISFASATVGDMDGDGKPDIIVFGGGHGLGIFRNTTGDVVAPTFTPTTAYTGQTVTITGRGFTAVTGVRFGGIPAQSYTVESDSVILVKVSTGASGNVSVLLSSDSIVMPGFTFLPLPAITTTKTSFCQGDADTLISSAVNGNQWYKNGELLQNDTARKLVIRVAGVYTVTASLNGTTTPPSGAVAIVVNPIPPAPTITLSGSDLVSSSDTGNQWYQDTTNLLRGAVGQHYKPDTSGYYALTITRNGCVSPFSAKVDYHVPPKVDSSLVTTPPTAVPNDSIHIGPNPIGNTITINYDQRTVTGGLSVTITNLNGNTMTTRTAVLNGDKIDVSALPKGSYVIVLLGNGGKVKVVRQLLKL